MSLSKYFDVKNHAPEKDELGTGLRLTDVIFGFVFKEIFFRLADWNEIPTEIAWTVRLHLILVATVVIGSYIGYRNSLKRADYGIWFVNLPMVKFGLDQAMVVLYFVLATRTPDDPAEFTNLTKFDVAWIRGTVEIILWIMVLYAAWDIVSFLMTKHGYGVVKFRWLGFYITFGSTLAIGGVLVVLNVTDPSVNAGRVSMVVVCGLLILYRVMKDHRKPLPKAGDGDGANTQNDADKAAASGSALSENVD